MFGNAVPTLRGSTILYRWRNSSLSSLPDAVVQTGCNGTGSAQTKLPIQPFRTTYTLQTQISRQLPSTSFSWESSPCGSYFGYSSTQGCSLCSASEYSISPSFQPCIPCNSLQNGGSCMSVEFKRLHIEDTSTVFGEAKDVTAVSISDGYWPALLFSNSLSRNTVAPIFCPYDFCLRGGVELLVTGVSSSKNVVNTSDPSSVCNQRSNREASSPLCGKCKQGFSEWNSVCQDCSDGVSSTAVFLFLVERIVWSLVLLIFAQAHEREESASILIFFTQSLFMLTFPQDVLIQLQNMVLFRSFFYRSKLCLFNVSVPAALALNTIMPLLSLVLIWVFYIVHNWIARCIRSKIVDEQQTQLENKSGDISDGLKRSAHAKCASCNRTFALWFVQAASPSPYLRASALVILNIFGPMIFSVFLVWNCISVPVSLFACLLF